MGVPYRIVVEENQFADYARNYPEDRLLILDPEYQRKYETLAPRVPGMQLGPGPVRNFCWDHAISEGWPWFWTMDDNIRLFARLQKNRRTPVGDGTILHAMETFVLRYTNVAMAGPHYWMFGTNRYKSPPFQTGTRIYSCQLTRSDVPLRYRGCLNDDTITCIDILKAGWNTVLFNTFLQFKLPTQTLPGGCTGAVYAREGTIRKSRQVAVVHPDVAKVVWRFNRWHHFVDYSQWRNSPLIKREDYDPAEEPTYDLVKVARPDFRGRSPE